MVPQVQHWKTRAETTEQRIAQLQAQVTGTIDVTASATDRRDDGIAQVDVVQSMHGDGDGDSSVRTRETGASGGYTASDIDGSDGGMRFAADTTDDLFVAPSSAEAQLDALLAQVRTDLAVSLRNQHRAVVADAVAGAVEATALERDEEWQRLVHEWRHRKLATLHRLRREEGVGMLAELEASHGVEAVMAYICGPAWDGKPMWPACDATTEESTSIAMTPARQGQGPHGGSPGDAGGTPGASSSGGAGADADAAAAAKAKLAVVDLCGDGLSTANPVLATALTDLDDFYAATTHTVVVAAAQVQAAKDSAQLLAAQEQVEQAQATLRLSTERNDAVAGEWDKERARLRRKLGDARAAALAEARPMVDDAVERAVVRVRAEASVTLQSVREEYEEALASSAKRVEVLEARLADMDAHAALAAATKVAGGGHGATTSSAPPGTVAVPASASASTQTASVQPATVHVGVNTAAAASPHLADASVQAAAGPPPQRTPVRVEAAVGTEPTATATDACVGTDAQAWQQHQAHRDTMVELRARRVFQKQLQAALHKQRTELEARRQAEVAVTAVAAEARGRDAATQNAHRERQEVERQWQARLEAAQAAAPTADASTQAAAADPAPSQDVLVDEAVRTAREAWEEAHRDAVESAIAAERAAASGRHEQATRALRDRGAEREARVEERVRQECEHAAGEQLERLRHQLSAEVDAARLATTREVEARLSAVLDALVRQARGASLDGSTESSDDGSRAVQGALPPPSSPKVPSAWRPHVDAATAVWRDRVSALRRQHEVDVARLTARHQDELSIARQRAEADAASREAAVREDASRRLQDALDELRSRLQTATDAEVQRAKTAASEAAVAEARVAWAAQYERDMAAMRAELLKSAPGPATTDATPSSTAVADAVEAATAPLRSQLAAAADNLAAAVEQQRQQSAAAHAAELERLQSALQLQLAQKDAECERRVAEGERAALAEAARHLADVQRGASDAADARHKIALDAARGDAARAQQALDAATAAHQVALAQLRDAHAEDVRRLQGELRDAAAATGQAAASSVELAAARRKLADAHRTVERLQMEAAERGQVAAGEVDAKVGAAVDAARREWEAAAEARTRAAVAAAVDEEHRRAAAELETTKQWLQAEGRRQVAQALADAATRSRAEAEGLVAAATQATAAAHKRELDAAKRSADARVAAAERAVRDQMAKQRTEALTALRQQMEAARELEVRVCGCVVGYGRVGVGWKGEGCVTWCGSLCYRSLRSPHRLARSRRLPRKSCGEHGTSSTSTTSTRCGTPSRPPTSRRWRLYGVSSPSPKNAPWPRLLLKPSASTRASWMPCVRRRSTRPASSWSARRAW